MKRGKMPFFIIFLIIPLIEIALFIGVGDEIGLLKTLLLCVLTAFIGGMLVRHQGLQTLFKAQNNLRTGAIPLTEIFDGFCIVIAGALLLTPGFFTDIIGFSLLVPQFRHIARGFLGKTTHFQQTKPHGTKSNGNVIEGDYETLDNDDNNK